MPVLAPIADWVRSRPLLRRAAHRAMRLIPDVRYTMRVPELGPVRIRLRRHRWLLWEKFGQSDTLMFATFARLIRPGDVVYDIGANIGMYSRVMVQWFGAARVVAFEPMRENFELLAANIRLGDLQERIRAFRMALSDVEGEEELQIDDMTSGSAVLNSVSGGAASDGRKSFGLPPLSERVTIGRLDDLIEREQLRPPQVMKIDTEGAEVKVLAGARQTLIRHGPRLAIALHGHDKADATMRLLDELGYLCYGFVNDPAIMWRRLLPTDARRLANNNIVASRDVGDVCEEIHPSWSLSHRQIH